MSDEPIDEKKRMNGEGAHEAAIEINGAKTEPFEESNESNGSKNEKIMKVEGVQEEVEGSGGASNGGVSVSDSRGKERNEPSVGEIVSNDGKNVSSKPTYSPEALPAHGIGNQNNDGGIGSGKGFLKRFSNLSKTIKTNPAVARAGVVWQSTREVMVTGGTEHYAGRYVDSDEDDNKTDTDAPSEEDTRRHVAQTAQAAAAAVTHAVVAQASASASSNVSTGMRGRYQMTPPADRTSVQGSGVLQNLARQGNRLLANAVATPSPYRSPTPGGGGVHPISSSSSSSSHHTPGMRVGTRSQTSLILDSSAGPHVQALLSTLKPGEYVLFLGPGFMGVNLKQACLPKRGVYVDFVVAGGAADRSGVVGVGDAVLRVGDVDVTSGTIHNVPGIIAGAERPVVVVLQRDFPVTGTPLDAAIGKCRKVQEEARNVGLSVPAEEDEDKHAEKEEEKTEEKNENDETSGKTETEENSEKQEEINMKIYETNGDNDQTKSVAPPMDEVQATSMSSSTPLTAPATPASLSSFATAREIHTVSGAGRSRTIRTPTPNRSVRLSLAAYANRRFPERSGHTALARASFHDSEFRAVVREAFLACCSDARCLSFLASHFSREDAYDAEHQAAANKVINGNSTTNTTATNATASNSTQSPTSSVMLMCYLELLSYEELHGVTPVQRRSDHASRIAHKFFLESSSSRPMFDLRPALDEAVLEELQHVLSKDKKSSDNVDDGDGDDAKQDKKDAIDQNEPPCVIPIDVFGGCREAIEDSLAPRFASFLVSDECYRMRAYLRGCSPYRDVPLRKLWKGLVRRDADSRNYFVYTLMHLVGGSDDDADSPTSSSSAGAGGICAALYLRSEVLPLLDEAASLTAESTTIPQRQTIRRVFEVLWEVHLNPSGGTLEKLSHSNGCQEALDEARIALLRAVEQPYPVKALCAPELGQKLETLSNELLYDYAVKVHPRFRESLSHELACAELRDVDDDEFAACIAEDDDENDNRSSTRVIPAFPEGCVARLVRQSYLPDRVSTHRPRRTDGDAGISGVLEEPKISRSLTEQLDREANREDKVVDSEVAEAKTNGVDDRSDKVLGQDDINNEADEEDEEDETDLSDHTADYAVVFGLDDDESSVTQSAGGLRRVKDSSIRRFLEVSLAENGNPGGSVPDTLESYAVVPQFKDKTDRFRTSSPRVSDDGWEASLVNFAIPSSTPDGPQQFLYGVSLVLRQRTRRRHASTPNRPTVEARSSFWSRSPSFPRTDSRSKLKSPPGGGVQVGLHVNRDRSTTPRLSNPDAPQVSAFTTHNTHDEEDDDAVCMVFEAPHSSPLFGRSPGLASPDAVDQALEQVESRLREEHNVSDTFMSGVVDRRWSRHGRKGGNTVGLALISSRPILPSMRAALSDLYRKNSRDWLVDDEGEGTGAILLGPLVDVLGGFSASWSSPSEKDHRPEDLRRWLRPHLEKAASPWIGRPLSVHAEHFEDRAGAELLQSLPPVPLALLFVSALLERKVAFCSVRRSVLLSASVGLRSLLGPRLPWSHLAVPLVPAPLARDLLQYPAPFLVGVAVDEAQSSALLRDGLPPEVTLVDLDVGRVALASSFAGESHRVRGGGGNTVGALRSQTLRLAEALGDLFGEKCNEESWRCDDPDVCVGSNANETGGDLLTDAPPSSPYRRIRKVCHDFVDELLTGARSCCYWLEESSSSQSAAKEASLSSGQTDTTVLFDEGRFLHLKNLREGGHYGPLPFSHSPSTINTVGGKGKKLHSSYSPLPEDNHLAMGVDDFGLVLESFLRTQAMSNHVSSLSREGMVYW